MSSGGELGVLNRLKEHFSWKTYQPIAPGKTMVLTNNDISLLETRFAGHFICELVEYTTAHCLQSNKMFFQNRVQCLGGF